MLSKILKQPAQLTLNYFKRNMSKRLFEEKDHAEKYAQFRPDYPKFVIETIVNYYKSSLTNFGLAVDVGCGSGQSTAQLKGYFNRIIGLDVSASQIAQANRRHDGIEFRTGPAEDLSFLGPGEVDLITVAQAMHWIDQGLFYSEVQRVLKPGGVLAVYGYGCPVENKEEAHKLVSHFYSNPLSTYWDERRHFIEEHYRSFKLPFSGWERNDTLEIIKHWKVDQYIGYISSWSSWQKYIKENPESDLLKQLHIQLSNLYPDNELMAIRWPVFILLGTKPKH